MTITGTPTRFPNGDWGVKVSVDQVSNPEAFGLEVRIQAKNGSSWLSKIGQLVFTVKDGEGKVTHFKYFTNENDDPLLSEEHDQKVIKRIRRHIIEELKDSGMLPEKGTEGFEKMMQYVERETVEQMHWEVKNDLIYSMRKSPRRYQEFWVKAKGYAEDFVLDYITQKNQSAQ